ncbi:hypothetical protein Ahy_B03g065290 [Arachis hypogaea]|uniref:Uncharacterized protein n=1 Tax=Arachis hypogaea TaxID=3818 RepID=A0A445A194_ARAHY|nr:hypothetical protein Ahy_B03g065290 [Arachis hypogaea]
MAIIAEVVKHIVLSYSSDQDIPLEKCEGSTKPCSEEESMEPQGKEGGLELKVQQEGESEVCEPEERKGELRVIDQDEDSIIDDFLFSLINPLKDPNEPLPLELEKDMKVDFSRPPCYDESDREEEEEVGEKGVDNQKHIEWVVISPMSFIGPHQYAILETNYQLKVFLGLVSGGERSVGSQRTPRIIKKVNSKIRVQAWCRAQSGDFRRMLGCYKGQLGAFPSGLEHKDQQESEQMPGIWDPGGASKTKHGWRFKEEWKQKPP